MNVHKNNSIICIANFQFYFLLESFIKSKSRMARIYFHASFVNRAHIVKQIFLSGLLLRLSMFPINYNPRHILMRRLQIVGFFSSSLDILLSFICIHTLSDIIYSLLISFLLIVTKLLSNWEIFIVLFDIFLNTNQIIQIIWESNVILDTIFQQIS